MINRFIKLFFQKTTQLKNGFKKTENKKWSATTIMNEMCVQVGHLADCLQPNERIKEDGRKIDNLGDELCDVLMQTFTLCDKLEIDINMVGFKNFYFDCDKSIYNLTSLMGQITEAVMEIEGYRHNKERKGFSNHIDFISQKVDIIFSICFEIAKNNNIDLFVSYEKMIASASKFLAHYKK